MDNIIKNIAKRNLEVLFGLDDFIVSLKNIDGSLKLLIIDPKLNAVLKASTKLQLEWNTRVQMELRDNRPVEVQINVSDPEELADISKVVQQIWKKINDLKNIKDIYYMTDEWIITDFKEIGINYPNGQRDLIVKRNNAYTLMSWQIGTDTPTIKEITGCDVSQFLQRYSNDCDIDFNGSELFYFADWSEYEDLVVE